MRHGDVDRFFEEVGKKVNFPVFVYLTGGVASWLMGGNRPTEDIDFGLEGPQESWEQMSHLFYETSRRLGIPIQFSENISRWSMIEIPHYQKTAKLYKKIGTLNIYHLDVGSWSIGKMGRYYQSDLEDLLAVFKKQKPDPLEIIGLWARALKKSPKSTDQILFCKTVEDFLTRYGAEIWGKKCKPKEWISFFYNQAGIQKTSPISFQKLGL